ncbi:MAG: hypothetical protein WCH44_10685, partial [Betaproteobacteria bacterium]
LRRAAPALETALNSKFRAQFLAEMAKTRVTAAKARFSTAVDNYRFHTAATPALHRPLSAQVQAVSRPVVDSQFLTTPSRTGLQSPKLPAARGASLARICALARISFKSSSQWVNGAWSCASE